MNNSLAEVHPELVSEWSEKNIPLTPDDITFGSNKKVWWRGACGHEWQTSVKARSNGEKCPICSGARVIAGINDLATLEPLLVKQWSKKNKIKPTEVSIGSHKKVIWRCEKGHEWEAAVKSRTINKTGCPYCSHNKVLAGFNDLATLLPDIAAEWSDRNYPLPPTQVTVFANRKAWWKCKDCRREWNTLISTRSGGSKCPYCSGYIFLKGFNDLQTMAEEIQEAVQIIRVAYDGIEIAMKVGSGGIAAMQKAIDFLKGMLDYEKSLGKTSMRKLILKGGDLQVLQFNTEDMKKVEKMAKKYGILYSVLPDCNRKDGLSEVIFHTEAVPRVNMMIQKLKFGKIATFDDYLKNGDEKSLGKLMDFLKKQQGNEKSHTIEGDRVNTAIDGLIEKVGMFAMRWLLLCITPARETICPARSLVQRDLKIQSRLIRYWRIRMKTSTGYSARM